MSSQTAPDCTAALASVRAYHQRTKHRFEGYAPGPDTLDWDEQPAPFRHFTGAPQIALPRLAEVTAGSPLEDALARPFAALSVPSAALPAELPTLGALLQLSLGLTAWKSLGPDRWAVRANPSSGNLHPTEAYLLAQGIHGLGDGLYHYRPETHALELRARHPNRAGEPRLGLLLSSVMWREAWKYGARAFRYCQLDCGHAIGALRYAAAALGWTLSEQAHLGQATLAWLAGTDRQAEFPARRQAETEREEVELLLAVGLDGGPAAPWTPEELAQLADRAVWQGMASPIDRHPMYRWPMIEEVAAVTRHVDRPAAPAAPRPWLVGSVSGEVGQQPVRQLLSERRSAQRFDHYHQMPLSQFASLLAPLQPSGLPWDVMEQPSRIALVLFVSHVESLVPGLYLLPRTLSQLAELKQNLSGEFVHEPVAGVPGLLQLKTFEPMPLQRIARSLHCHQDLAANACFAVCMLAEFDATLAAQGPAGYRQLHREAGLIGQVLYLQAEAHGLRGTGIGCFFDDPVHALLGLEGSAWQSLYHFTVGRAITDRRIETTPAYS
ncbi:SagB/ThcOx family dehydrogenase [Stutzerimonas tarimensis]|uniref:SagB/ThcOx family dehydrogenase n=1 Tax=Stutzerimonas tarimensis TaxID=1507735 RepID=A0ABV7T6V1_9GAMM